MPNGHFKKCEGSKCTCEIRWYWLVLSVLVLTGTLEVVGGLYARSLSLLADAGHVATDSLAVLLTILVTHAVRRGWHESTVRGVGGLMSALLLTLAAAKVLSESLERLAQPANVAGLPMLLVAVVGGLGNITQKQLLGHSPGKQHVSYQALSLHVVSDLLLSIAVVIGGALVWLTGETRIDPAISLAASFVIAFWAVRLGLVSFRTIWGHASH